MIHPNARPPFKEDGESEPEENKRFGGNESKGRDRGTGQGAKPDFVSRAYQKVSETRYSSLTYRRSCYECVADPTKAQLLVVVGEAGEDGYSQSVACSLS